MLNMYFVQENLKYLGIYFSLLNQVKLLLGIKFKYLICLLVNLLQIKKRN
jgi:hypothetical protein